VYNRSSSTLTTAPSRTPAPRLPSTVSETTNLQHVQALQQAKNGRTGAITTAATRKEGPDTGTSSCSQNSKKLALQSFQFFFRLSNGWENPVGEETSWSCWLPVDLEEVANNNNLQSPFYKLQQHVHVTLGISVVPTQFVSRDAVPTNRIKKESSLPLSSPARLLPLRLSPEVRIKTEPVFELGQRTTAPSSTLEFIDLTADSSDESLPELSEVLSQPRQIETEQTVVVTTEPGAHKRGGTYPHTNPSTLLNSRSL
jgi:hypothetical protein